jgi:hypothetical protein
LLAIVPESSPPPSSPLKEKRDEKKERSDETDGLNFGRKKAVPLSYVRFESEDSITAGKSTMSAAHISRR